MKKIMATKNGIGQLELISAMILSGTIGMFVVLSDQPVINVVFYRCVIGALILVMFIIISRYFGKIVSFSITELASVMAIGTAIVLNWLSLFYSYNYISIGVATTIYHVQPIIVFFVGAVLFKEKMTAPSLLWLGLAFLGVLLITNPLVSGGLSSHYLTGCLLAFMAACLYAIATLVSRTVKVTSPYVITFIQMIIGSIILFPFVKLSIFPQTPLQYSSIVILGVVHSAIMYILLYSSYQKLTTSTIAILSYIYPIVAIATDMIVFNKTLSLLQFMGVAMILLAGLSNKLSLNPFTRINKTRRSIIEGYKYEKSA